MFVIYTYRAYYGHKYWFKKWLMMVIFNSCFLHDHHIFGNHIAVDYRNEWKIFKLTLNLKKCRNRFLMIFLKKRATYFQRCYVYGKGSKADNINNGILWRCFKSAYLNSVNCHKWWQIVTKLLNCHKWWQRVTKWFNCHKWWRRLTKLFSCHNRWHNYSTVINGDKECHSFSTVIHGDKEWQSYSPVIYHDKFIPQSYIVTKSDKVIQLS